MKKNSPAALDCDDILRSAIVLVISSFDLLIHDLFRMEVLYRFQNKITVNYVKINFASVVASSEIQLKLIDEQIRIENSYRSFVSPDKLSECMRAFSNHPWQGIALAFGSEPEYCKIRLKAIVDLRNRIAHEADINPNYGGIELWPIYEEDVFQAIDFIYKLGGAVALHVDNS
jgi:hypothetical protein